MARTTSCVRDAQLVLSAPAEAHHTILAGSPYGHRWLGESDHRSFAFASVLGTFTTRNKRKQQEGWSWVAYRQIKSILYKTYPGKSEHLFNVCQIGSL